VIIAQFVLPRVETAVTPTRVIDDEGMGGLQCKEETTGIDELDWCMNVG